MVSRQQAHTADVLQEDAQEVAPDRTRPEEHALTEMMRYLPGLNPRRRRSPTPRPDFVVKKGTATVCLLGAKYRDPWERDLPRDMLHQLAIYALSQPRPSTATILFPTATAGATPAVVEIRDPMGTGVLGYVELRPVVLRELVSPSPVLKRRGKP
jgi:5-methylcytosine-specific restriction enzyme subunit McrC